MIPMSGCTTHSCNLHAKVVHGKIKRTTLNSVQKTLCFLENESMKLACNLIYAVSINADTIYVYVIGICKSWYNFPSTL